MSLSSPFFQLIRPKQRTVDKHCGLFLALISLKFLLVGRSMPLGILRVRWGSAKYNRAYFGVAAPGLGPVLPAYQPGSGIYAVGAVAGIHLPVGQRLGLFSYAGYDRLTGAAARSPIVKAGSQDQFSAGLALTYRFSI